MRLKRYAEVLPILLIDLDFILKALGSSWQTLSRGVSRSDLFLKSLSVIRMKDTWGGGGQPKSLGAGGHLGGQ